MSKTTKTDAPVLSPEMLAQNAMTQQTKWINFNGTPLCFYKRHVPHAPEGYKRYVHILRNVCGEAWIIERTDNEKSVVGMLMGNDVMILGRAYTSVLATVEGNVAGALIDDAGRIYLLSRCTDYDKRIVVVVDAAVARKTA